MLYRINPKNGDKLSQLGCGCMRFQKDDKELEKQIVTAIGGGVNYFDTAYLYPHSEERLGRALAANGLRGKVKLATKIPPFLVKKNEDFDKIFTKSLKRLQTDYIDYYLIHMLTDVAGWERLVSLGVLDWIAGKKADGKIINIGFSYHGGRAEFIKLCDVYDWDFCMIQYNFLDENNQAGKGGLEYAAAKGIPVIIMEPLRGGKLVTNLPKEVYGLWESAYVKRSPAEWAFRWVWNHPQVLTVLSGMNTLAQVEENVRVASEAEAGAFGAADYVLFEQARQILSEKIKVNCTGCGYCLPCPKGVDIPACFSCYNDTAVEKKTRAFMNYLMQTSMKKQTSNASLCVDCGRCVPHCPQNIAIPQELRRVKKKFEKFYFRPLRWAVKKFMKIK